jgi:hypothetical protein
MVGAKNAKKELFSYLSSPRGGKEPIADTVVMAVEFMKYQAEVAYEVGKKQVISITSTASTIGIGWSAFFFGLTQESWLTSSLGLMLVFAGTFFLGYWTPRILDGARRGLEEIGASKFYQKWLSDSAGIASAEKGKGN